MGQRAELHTHCPRSTLLVANQGVNRGLMWPISRKNPWTCTNFPSHSPSSPVTVSGENMLGRGLISSLYSDPFGLEALVRSHNGHGGDQDEISALIGERNALRREVDQARSAWLSICRSMTRVAEIAGALSQLHEDALRYVDLERKKWLANCTAI